MESEGSLPHSELSATCPYPETDQSNPFPPSHFLNIHLNIILPSRPRSSKLFFPSGLLSKSLHTPLLALIRATFPAHLNFLYLITRILVHRKQNIIPCAHRAPFVPPNLLRPTKSNLYLANSIAAAVSEPDPHMPLTFRVPNLLYIFLCLGHAKESVQDQTTCIRSETRPVFTVRCC